MIEDRYGQPLHASGVRFRLRQYVALAAKQHPRLRDKHVTPHTFRHTAAVHLVAAGVDVTVIQSWLGHAGDPEADRREHLKKLARLLAQVKREFKRHNDIFSSQEIMKTMIEISDRK